MALLERVAFGYMISQVVLYIVQAFFFLIPIFNKPQKIITQSISQSGISRVFFYAYFILITVTGTMFMDSFAQWKFDKQLISQHIDLVSIKVIEDKEDLYRHERNMYIFGTALFLSLANIRYYQHLVSHFSDKDKLKALKQ